MRRIERAVRPASNSTRAAGAGPSDGRGGDKEVVMARPSKLRVAVSDPGQWLSERERAQLLAPKLRALADETRLTLILLIAQRPRTVKELQEATGLSQTLVSHHLAPLREQELVEAIPQGRSNQYVMCCSALAEPLRMFASLAALDPETVAACLEPSAPAAATEG
ncbi:ArsR family transcriptional regulator [Streptomyces dioscori]|uniref:ArsR family transcriptional regulator n=2 Tax=Streptomyces TaxID=1883 RepID=A0A2P8Q0V9_9ACTN|nr:ArsR family transcriptional regulator [Streptomyces dioscori]